MKKTLAVVTLLAGAVSGYSQGALSIADYAVPGGAFNITVWSPIPTAPGTEVQGNSAAGYNPMGVSDVPAGTTTYPGATPLGGFSTGSGLTAYGNGSLWSVELYAAAGTGIALSGLSPISGSVANFFTDSAVVGNPGEWNGSVVTFGGAGGTAGAPTIAAGSPVTVAIAAWYNGGGAYTSYAAAVTAGSSVAPYGISSTGSVALTGAPNPPAALPALGNANTLAGGITSFSLITSSVPEPSTIALGVMGASAFLMRLRRK